MKHYQTLYQKKLSKRIFLEFIFGFVVMYLGCKIHPTSLWDAQPIYLSTAVVFALYSIRGYRITAGLLLGGILAYYFSPANHEYGFIFTKLLSSFLSTTQLLFCAFFMRYLLDKFHIALVSMRNLKEIFTFIIISLIIPQVVFNILITSSTELMITGLGHTLGILTISSIFLVWDAYVPKISPPPLAKSIFIFTNALWLAMGGITYGFCYYMYTSLLFLFIFIPCYLILMLFLIIILSKISNRFFSVIGMGFFGLAVLFYAILHPDMVYSREINTAYIQISLIFISALWLGLLAKIR